MDRLKFETGQQQQESKELTTDIVLSLLIEVIQVTIEQIWYYRTIYPKASFEKAKSFQLEVYTSRHPGVTKYLDDLCFKLRTFLERGILERVFVEIFENNSLNISNDDNNQQRYQVKERYGFSFKDSVLLELLRNSSSSSGSNNNTSQRITFTNEFSVSVLYAELQSFLYSIIQELGVLDSRDKTKKNVLEAAMRNEGNWDLDLEDDEEEKNRMNAGGCLPRTFKILVGTDKQRFGFLAMSEDWILERSDLSYDNYQEQNGRGTNNVKRDDDGLLMETSTPVVVSNDPLRRLETVDLKVFREVNLGYWNIKGYRAIL